MLAFGRSGHLNAPAGGPAASDELAIDGGAPETATVAMHVRPPP